MCGISGAFEAQFQHSESALRSALQAIVHRGPDGQGTYSDVNGSFIDALLRREVMNDRNRTYNVYALLVLELSLREERAA